MINQVYRLVSSRRFEIAYKERTLLSDEVVVRPTHLSICAADQRYYTGSRRKEVMSAKLPMALIHEGIGKIAFDPTGQLPVGTQVVMVPNQPVETDPIIAENYLRTSKFRSSGYDGFMQDYVFLKRDRVVPLFDGVNPYVAAFIELITISVHAISRMDKKSHARREVYGVWGDGNLGFITAMVLKKKYPNSRILVFGKTAHKLDRFAFADATYQIDQIPSDVHIDHAVECAGGVGSQTAINQIIDHIRPEGTIAILGVSEYPAEINTRMILEKGLTVIGSSRSGRVDFEETVNLLKENPDVQEYFETLVGSVSEVKTLQDIVDAFERDLITPWGKSIMEWNI